MIRRLFCFRLPTNGKLSVPTKLRPEKGIEFHRPARSPPLRPPAGRPSTQCRQSGAIHALPEPPAIVSGAPVHGTARTRPNVGHYESVAPPHPPRTIRTRQYFTPARTLRRSKNTDRHRRVRMRCKCLRPDFLSASPFSFADRNGTTTKRRKERQAKEKRRERQKKIRP